MVDLAAGIMILLFNVRLLVPLPIVIFCVPLGVISIFSLLRAIFNVLLSSVEAIVGTIVGYPEEMSLSTYVQVGSTPSSPTGVRGVIKY